jgi:cysteine synthase
VIRAVPGGHLVLGGRVQGGSLKYHLMDALLAEADLPAGSLVADLSAGLGAVALAQAARRRKLFCRVYVPESAPAAAVTTMREAGADVRLCPPTMDALAAALTELAVGHESKEFYWTRQNYRTCDAYRGLAEGLTVGRPDHLVAGVGTGSSLRSFGGFFQERNPALKLHAILSSDLGGLRPPGMTLDFAGLRDVGSPEELRGVFGDRLQTYTMSREHHADSTQAVLHVMQGLQNAVGISVDGR